MEWTQKTKPSAPHDHLVHELHIDDAEHEDELVEEEVPELVFEVLMLRDSQFTKHKTLDELAQQDQRTVCRVDQCLEQTSGSSHFFREVNIRCLQLSK